MRHRLFPLVILLLGTPLAGAQTIAPRVVSVHAVDQLPESPGALAPNHEVELVVAGLDQICAPPAGRTSQPGLPLQLFLDGEALPGTFPLASRPDAAGTHLRFFLPADQATQTVWTWVARTTNVLDEPTVKVAVSVGYSDCTLPQQAQALDATVLVLRRTWRNLWLFLVIGLAALLIWLGHTTNLLRDPSPNRPYSLAKTQAAWWFYLILSGFALVLMVTGFPPALSNDALILLGLSSITGVLGGVLEGQQTEKVVASGGIHQSFLGFWRDLLLDPSTNGISLGRLQFVAWTVVIGVYFAYSVVTSLTLPDLGNQLLLLQGISAGTYVAVKNGEG